MEFIERLEVGDYGAEERWLVRVDGASEPHVAWFFYDDELEWLAETNDATRPYVGPIHPRISTIFGSAWHGQRLVFEVEDDRGPMLATAARELADPVERERWVIAQVIGIADGLATLRGRDPAFVHRQLEAYRIFVDVQGHAKLRAPIAYVAHGERPNRVGAGVIRGTPYFMSPEQARGTRVTAASDVFSLATNLYLALSGHRPFEGESFIEVLAAILQNPPPPLATHAPGLAGVLERAFAKDPAARIPDPGTFAGELWQCAPDAMEYDAVISDKLVAWRASAPSEPATGGAFAGRKCRMKWEQLAPTQHADIRHCAGCHQDVVRVRSIAAVVPLLGQHCVAYTGGD